MDERDGTEPPARGRGERWREVGGSVAGSVAEGVAGVQQQVRDAVRAGAASLGEDDAELAALGEAVLAVPGVLALHPGVLGDLAARLPGRRAPGITATDDETTVRVVLADDAPVHATATAVRDVAAGVSDAPVRVVVEDVRAAR
ncbi:hypothetical protein [Rhodococcus aerolatus]